MFRGYELWQYYSSSDSEGDEMSKTRTGTDLGPPAGALETPPVVVPPIGEEPIPTTFQGYTPRQLFPGTLNHVRVAGQATLRATTIVGVPNVTSHAPAGIGWIPQSAWDSAVWDGVPYNVAGKTKAQVCNWVFPTSNTMRGLRQLYETVQPFADPVSPTWQEIDAWNIKVITHFRALFGLPPIKPTYRLYAEAQWSTERRWSTRWNGYPNPSSRPGADGSLVYGPCPNANVHCGATFIPDEYEQVHYMLPNNQPTSSVRRSVAEGLGGTNTNIPWSIKLGRVIASFLCIDGLTGHTGPFLRREEMGMVWHELPDGTTQVRFKWGGTYTPFNGE